MKFVLRYHGSAQLDMDQVRTHFPAHRARWQVFRDRGSLLLIGPFADPRQGALAVFTTNEAAEEFVATDPFIINGLVSSWTITEWNEVLLDPI